MKICTQDVNTCHPIRISHLVHMYHVREVFYTIEQGTRNIHKLYMVVVSVSRRASLGEASFGDLRTHHPVSTAFSIEFPGTNVFLVEL